MSYSRQRVQAVRDGDVVRLRLLKSRQAQAVAFDQEAPLIDRVLAAVASDVMRQPVAEAMLRDTPELQAAVVDLANAQAGDVTIGHIAGRDIITIHVHVGGEP